MKIIILHAQGNTNVRHTVIGFFESGVLSEFHTSIAVFPGSFLYSLAGFKFLSDIRRRSMDITLRPYTHSLPLREICRLIFVRIGLNQLTKQETGFFSVEKVMIALDKKVANRLENAAKNGIKSVYAYEDGALYSFLDARKNGIKCFYDLPTGYWRAKQQMLVEQELKYPEWKVTMPGLFDSKEKLDRKDKEIENADCIIVASKFTASTLSAFPGKLPPVKIVPYGFPEPGPVRDYNSYSRDLPIKLLFVGSLSQQKGLVNLFQAVKILGNKVSLTIVGRKPLMNCHALNIELENHNWIPSLAHPEILQLMRQHDVLVFPTLFDGFGLVITEAMSQGTPVIATYNSAGPDLIEHNKNGWLVKADSTDELQMILERLVANPQLIAEAGNAAMETAGRRPWSVFRKEISEAVLVNYH